jgi:hypothetical protein
MAHASIIVMLRFLSPVMLVLVLASCSTSPSTASSFKSYFDVKKEYLAALEKSSAWGPPSNFRLAIIPPGVEPYPPGTPLSKDSYEPLTNSCLVRDVTVSKQLANPPMTNSATTFNVSLEPPPFLAGAFLGIVDFKTQLAASDQAVFHLSLSKSETTRTDVVERAMLNEQCLHSVVGRDIVMIRGLIHGSEVIAARQGLRGDAVLKVLDADNLTVRHDSSGGYEVRDTESRPKFWIITEMHPDIPGYKDLTSPNQRLTQIRRHIGEELAGISFNEHAPTIETVAELSKTIPPAPIRLQIR